jgi:hypothetical protein
MMKSPRDATPHAASRDQHHTRRAVRPLVPAGLVLLALLAGPTPRVATAEDSAPASAPAIVPIASGFTTQVEANFERWDRDHDGALSFVETSELVPDATIRDEAAAALAAIHLAQRGERWAYATFSRAELTAALGGEDARRLPPFETYHRVSLAHIRATARGLFVGEAPRLRDVHQGLLGDCYFVATLGALVARDPTEVGRIVREDPDKTFHVRFPDGETVRVGRISDAEIALGSYALGQGLWLNVLEKAYGLRLARMLARRGDYREAIDALGQGGVPTSALALYTGNDAAVLRFREEATPMITGDRRVAAYLPLARSTLIDTLRNRRLVCCSTTTGTTPPGLPPSHLYAVLGFDAEHEVVHVWNPWGDHFEPKGAPGVESGFPTKDGFFDVPLTEFIRIFDALTYQTDRLETLE